MGSRERATTPRRVGAQLTSAQLSTCYVGHLELSDIRAAWEKDHGKYPELRALHDAMLAHGTAGPKYVRERLGSRSAKPPCGAPEV